MNKFKLGDECFSPHEMVVRIVTGFKNNCYEYKYLPLLNASKSLASYTYDFLEPSKKFEQNHVLWNNEAKAQYL